MATQTNRVSEYSTRQRITLYFDQHYFDIKESQLASSIERYALHSLTERIERLEKQVSQIQETQEQLLEKQADLERATIRIKSQITGAMDVVAAFSKQNLERISDVIFGWCDNEYRFIIVSKSENFDWDLCDKITDVEAILLEDYPDIPLSCKCVPLSAKDDLRAVLELNFCRINFSKL